MDVKKIFWAIVDKLAHFFSKGLGDEILLMVTGTGVAMLLPGLSKIIGSEDATFSWKIAIIDLAIIILLFMFLIQLKADILLSFCI